MEDQGLNSVPLDQIDPSPRNPRSKPGHLEELADSMQAYGVLQPVVVRYPSDLPMNPIQLTTVGAVPHMGIEVSLLGPSRGIPRNYHHTVVNDALIDWSLGGAGTKRPLDCPCRGGGHPLCPRKQLFQPTA